MPALADEFALPEVAAPARASLLDEFDAPPPRLTEDLARDAGHKAIEWERTWKDAKTPEAGVELVRKWVGDKAADAFSANASKVWEESNIPLVNIPRLNAPGEADTPTSMQPRQRAGSVLAGTYNAVAGVAESLTTPFNIGTLGAFGALNKAAQGVGMAARAAQWALAAVKGGFGAEMAKGAGEQAGAAFVDLADPNKSLQEKTESALAPVITGGLAIISAASGGKDVADLRTTAKVKVTPKTTEEMVRERMPEVPEAKPGPETAKTPPDKLALVQEGVKDPAVQFQLSVWDRNMVPEGQSRVRQVDLISDNAPNGEGNWASAAPDLLRELGVKLPEPPEWVPSGRYTPDQLREVIAKGPDGQPPATSQQIAPEPPTYPIEKTGEPPSVPDRFDDEKQKLTAREIIEYSRDDRSHGDEYLAAAAKEVLAELEQTQPGVLSSLDVNLKVDQRRKILSEIERRAVEIEEKTDAIDIGEPKTLDPRSGEVAAEIIRTIKPPPNVADEFTAPPASETVLEPPPETPVKGGATLEPLESRTTSIKNAIVDQERAERGLPPAMEEAKRDFPQVWDEAMKRVQNNPEVGDNLVTDLKAKARPLTDIEDAILLRHQIEAQNEFAVVSKRIAEGRGTPEELATDRQAQSQLADDLLDVYNVGKAAGTESGRGLNARKMLADENYTLGQMVTLRRALKGGAELTPEELVQTEKLQAKIEELQAEFDDYRTRASELLMTDDKPATPRKKSVGGRVMAALSEQAVAARARIKTRLTSGQVSAGIDPALLADYAIIGADYIAKGISKTADWGAAMVREFGEQIRPHLAAIRAQADEKVRTDVDPVRTEAFKKRTAKRIEELKKRIAAGDLAKRERRPIEMDPESNRLQAELEAVKAEFIDAMERDKYEQLSATEKVWKQAVRGYDLQRVFQTTGELSFFLRQGAFAAASAPIRVAQAVPNTMRAIFSSPVEARALDLQVFNHPEAKAALRAKLPLVEQGAKLSRQEDIFAADLVEKVWGLRHIAQANRVFLNKLRFDIWRDMRNSAEITPERDRQLAQFTSQQTGRGGLGKLEPLAIPLGRLLFAPHFLASRVQMVVGHSMWGGDAVTRKIIAKRYARALVGAGAYYTAMSLTTGDEKNPPTIEWDSRSTDFGKVKIGDTRIDPLGGMAQVITVASRLATGETKTAKGRIIKADPAAIAARFLRTKLAPIPGSALDIWLGTDVVGNPATFESEALNMAYPITYGDIYEMLKESEDMTDEAAFAMLALLGQGMQTYDANERRKRPLKPNPANKP